MSNTPFDYGGFMSTYILIDLSNLLHRAKHVTSGTVDLKIGMSMHIIFNSILKMWRKFDADHIVVCLDSKSWRREVYTQYKAARRLTVAQKSVREQEEDDVFNEAFNDLVKFLDEKTNVTVLKSVGLEADDFIAQWVKIHPNDLNVIISSDSDFYQLLAVNVKIFNGVTDLLITKDGVYDEKDRKLEFTLKNDGKLKVGKPNENFNPDSDWVEWAKFSKIMRGDAGDGIFTAYPKVRQTALRNAYDDRKGKGYNWNNLMLQTWTDHEGVTHRVLDCFERNRMLIDLNDLPPEIAELTEQVINETTKAKHVPNIGIWFKKFCHLHNLQRLEKNAINHATYLASPYKKD